MNVWACSLEWAMAMICQEAGAAIKSELGLQALKADVPVFDERRVDVLADSMCCRQGRQLAIDAKWRLPLT